MDATDRNLLNEIQHNFPLVEYPFRTVAGRVGISEEECLERLVRLKREGIIRQISAIFDSGRLGYKSVLVAASVREKDIERAAAVINECKGVSHNYLRDHPFNIWFTLTLPAAKSFEEETLRMSKRGNFEKLILLPSLRVFKIGVRLEMEESPEVMQERETDGVRSAGRRFPVDSSLASSGAESPSDVERLSGAEELSNAERLYEAAKLSSTEELSSAAKLSGAGKLPGVEKLAEEEKKIVRILQDDLPLVSTPFLEMSRKCGMSIEDFLKKAVHLKEAGIMRRFAAVLHHRRAGFAANGMGAWIVPKEQVEQFGRTAAGFKAVSHCYERPTYPPDWPYNLFTMIHARSEQECQEIAARISEETRITDYRLLFSTREFKKVRVRYFEED